jgi:hypothetical protein
MGQGIVNLVGHRMSIFDSRVASPLNFWNKQCKR